MIRRLDRELVVQLALLAALVVGLVTAHHTDDAARPPAPVTAEDPHAGTASASADPQDATHPAGTSHGAPMLVHLCLAALVASSVLLAGAGLGRSLRQLMSRAAPAAGIRLLSCLPFSVHAPPPRLLLCVLRT